MSRTTLPTLGSDGMIVEGVVTTLNEDGSVNISPMGPIVDASFQTFVLRPFQTSTTYLNLVRHGQGVFHVTDDVSLIAQAAVGTPAPLPRLSQASAVEGSILTDACRYYEFEIESCDNHQTRAVLVAKVRNAVRQRDFLGFNRGQHAVLEAAILATRLHLLPSDEIAHELERLAIPLAKTGSAKELAAFDFLCHYIVNQQPANPSMA